MNENDLYHGDTTRVSKSGLDLISKAPALYYARYLDPNRILEKKTEALITGSALHTIVLEGHKFADEFVVSPEFHGEGSKSRRIDFTQANAGKSAISVETYNTVSYMRDAILSHPIARELLSNGVVEERLNFECLETGAQCKIKPDFRNTEHRILVDLKSTEDASDRGFQKSAFTYRYHVQSAFYTDGSFYNGLNPSEFVFIAAEKHPPYLVNIFRADPEVVNLGRMAYLHDLQTYVDCKKSGKWPGYDPKIKDLGLPQWVRNNM